ncbi:MAG: hypothetical protein ACLQJR_09130 [Stellaceae bacterium]
MVADDAVVVVRDVMIRGHRVIVTAERIARLKAWLVIGRVDGELHDAQLSDFPEQDADEILAGIDREYE